jgi:hypothetical protein
MAKYLLLIYGDESIWEAGTAEDRERLEAGHGDFNRAAGDAVLAGHELAPTATATTLRGNPDRRRILTDGPFLEAKEVLGGYYLIEAPDLDSAIKLAERLPEVAASHSGVEIRPIVESS